MTKTSGPKQHLDTVDVSQLVAVTLRLAMVVSALRERVLTHEALLKKHNLLDTDAVNDYVPTAAEVAERKGVNRSLIEALARDLAP